MITPVASLFITLLGVATPVASSPELGQAEGRCRAGEAGSMLMVDAAGLKDRSGLLKLEVYPSTDADFLADDNVLVNAGKVFRRVVTPVAAVRGNLCVRLPGPGSYSVVLLHDRDADQKFGLSSDGVGFAGNPKLGWSKPKAAATRVVAGAGVTHIEIVMNYRRGLGMSPLPRNGASR